MRYNFSSFEKKYPAGKQGYRGASIGKSGIYITKSLCEELDLYDNLECADIQIDKKRNALLIVPVDYSKDAWSVSGEEDVSGLNIGGGISSEAFFKEINMPRGRYEYEGQHDGGYLFVYNQDL